MTAASLHPSRSCPANQVPAPESAIAVAKDEAATLAKKVPLRDLMDDKEIVQIETERKRIIDAIKMAPYRIESNVNQDPSPRSMLQSPDPGQHLLWLSGVRRCHLARDPSAGVREPFPDLVDSSNEGSTVHPIRTTPCDTPSKS